MQEVDALNALFPFGGLFAFEGIAIYGLYATGIAFADSEPVAVAEIFCCGINVKFVKSFER